MFQDPRRLPATEDQLLTELASYAMALLSGIGDAVIAVDVGARIVLMNPLAEQLTRWPAGESRGRPLDEVFQAWRGGGRLRLSPLVAEVVLGGTSQTVGAACLVARDGRRHEVGGDLVAIRDSIGVIRGALLVFDA